MQKKTANSNIRWAILLCAAGGAMMLLPEDRASSVRSPLRDLARPGLEVLQSIPEPLSRVFQGFHNGRSHTEQIARLEARLAAAERNARRANFNLPRAADSERSAAYLGTTPSQPLLIPELVDACIIGSETAVPWRNSKFLGAGRDKGLEESLLVLDDGATLVDQGASVRIDANDPVYADRVVVGRVAKVGTWTSTLELVTDKKFHGLACVMRETTEGFVPGPEGILTGDGADHCRLEVESAEPVKVGDAVCTVPDDGVLPLRMYYGRVIQVDLQPGSLHWEVKVEPALKQLRLRSVSVLRTKLNPARILANRTRD